MNKLDSILKQNKDIKDFIVFDTDAEWNQLMQQVEGRHLAEKKSKISFINIIQSIAASMIVIVLFELTLKEPEPSRREVFAKENQNITLTDGSIISMMTGTNMDYPLHFRGQNERKIIFKGSATFDVRKSILPFVIYTKDLKTEVLGTKFIMSQKSDTSYIETLEGIVKVSEIKNPDKSITLHKGDKFKYAGGSFTDLNHVEPVKKAPTVIKPAKNPVVEKAPPVEQAAEPVKPEGSVYKLGSVLKDYLVKQNKKLIKIDKKFKFDPEQRVRINLSSDFNEIIKSLKSQGIIDTKPGDCLDCIIIIAPDSGK
ncbi:MAG: FecR domain-containing protein [Saprospiraceae bacterium]|nr:FecR domain-containing protein [Saprospiraceae bacterium]